MTATIFDILQPVDGLGWASEKDFLLGANETVSPQILADQPDWSLYSLDLTAGLAWFVEMPSGFDLSASAFAYLDQRRHARRLLQVTLDDLIAVAAEVPPPPRVIFVFSIGRCGSTLVSHVLNTCPTVWGLSEPMAFPKLIMQNYDSDVRQPATRARLIDLIRACTTLQFKPPKAGMHEVLALKFHSQCLFHADLYHDAFPQAAFVFLYRDALGWTRSWYQMARKYGFAARLTGPGRAAIWNCVTAVTDQAQLKPYVDMDAAEVALEDELVIGWARNMEEYERLTRAGIPFLALRYNEINRDRAASLAQLFTHCGLPAEDAVAGLAAFERDSQAGELVSHDVVADALSAEQVHRLRGVLARHPRYGDPDARLGDGY